MNVGDMKAFDFSDNDHFAGFVVDFFDTGSFFMDFCLTGEVYTTLIVDDFLGDTILKDGVCYTFKEQSTKNLHTVNSPTSGIVSGFVDCDDCDTL